MFDWYVRVLLKNGKYVEFYLYSDSRNASDIIEKVFCGKPNVFYATTPSKENPLKQIVGVNRGEIAAYWLSPTPFEDQEN